MKYFRKKLKLTKKTDLVLDAAEELIRSHEKFAGSDPTVRWEFRELQVGKEISIFSEENEFQQNHQIYRFSGVFFCLEDGMYYELEASIILAGCTIHNWDPHEFDVVDDGQPLSPARAVSRLRFGSRGKVLSTVKHTFDQE